MWKYVLKILFSFSNISAPLLFKKIPNINIKNKKIHIYLITHSPYLYIYRALLIKKFIIHYNNNELYYWMPLTKFS